MIYIDIHNSEIEKGVRVGTLAEFSAAVVQQMREITFKSRLFTTKGIVTPEEIEKQLTQSIDHVFQMARDKKP